MGAMIFRCSDGHLFTASWVKILFLSAHFGNSVWTRCPVDHKWRMASRIARDDLSDAELDQAEQYHF
jgi:hypothetical protein